MKVVINNCYGGFGLSHTAFLKLREMGHKLALSEPDYGEPYSDGSGIHKPFIASRAEPGSFLRHIERNDPMLVKVVEEMGDGAWGECAKLKVIEIPDDVKWHVDEYDGMEHIAEDHRTWGND